MKRLFVIYGKPATGKTEFIKSTLNVHKNIWPNGWVDGTYVIDDVLDSGYVEEIINLFNNGLKEFYDIYGKDNVKKIVFISNRNLNYDEVMRIKNEVNDNIMISSFEAKKFIEGEWK